MNRLKAFIFASRFILFMMALLIFPFASLIAGAQSKKVITDVDWEVMNPEIPGTNGEVKTILYRDGNLYAGGRFTVAGGVFASNIAKWGGTSWSALGNGITGGVYALTVDSSGNLYAGGSFTTAGGVTANCIAKWDGTSWSALGSGMGGMDSTVYALAFDSSGNLYAGGWFTTAGGVTAKNIAKWNGASWSALGSGMALGSGVGSHVNALTFDSSGNLYAGGLFTTAGGVSANNIAKWNGTSWSALGSGLDGGVVMDRAVSALAFDASGNLYAGGYFTTAGGVTVNSIAKWNGTSWSALGSGMDSTVYALAFDSSGKLYAGGLFSTAGGVTVNSIAKWDGANWSALGSGMDSTVYALAFDSSNNLYTGGLFRTADGGIATSIAKWNGTSWSTLGSGINVLYISALAVDSSGNLYTGGSFRIAGGAVTNITKWDGTSWSALGSGMDGDVSALTVDSSGNLYAGGEFTTAGGVPANHIARWDGTSWSALGNGMNDSVYALTVDSSGNLYTGGGFTSAGIVTATNIAKWNGTSWSALGSGMNDSVYALTVDSSGNLYAGGGFTSAGGVTAYYIAKWDGTSWSAMGSGVDGNVITLAVDSSDNLYAGGGFTSAGGFTANYIAKWDGTSWSALGSGVESGVNILAIDFSDNLYVGRGSTSAGVAPANYIEKWDGTSWSALGSGVNGAVSALAVDSSGKLYAGGGFTSAGGKLSPYIAKCVIGLPSTKHIITASSDKNGNISPFGAVLVSDGVLKTFNITPNNNCHIVDVLVDGSSVGAVTNCTFSNITANHTISATFAVDVGDYSIGGTVTGAVTQDVMLTLSGAASSKTTSGADGIFTFAASDGSYTVTPRLSGYTFTPSSRNATVNGKNVTVCDFVATKNTGIYSISGTVSGAIQAGVTITLSDALSSSTLSDAYGKYSFTGLADGSYAVTPELSTYSFTPFSQDVTIAGANQTGIGFTSTAISIYGTISKPSFNASHKDAIKKIVGTYTQYSTDKFTVQAAIQFPAGFDLTTIGENTGFTFNFGLYLFSNTLGNAFKKKLDGANGGSATFKITGKDAVKGRTVTVEKVDLRWDNKKRLTVKITGTPASNSGTNVLDLSSKANGAVTGTIDTFTLTFNNAGAGFADGESLDYTGKKTTKTVIKDKGKPSEKTFTIVAWSAKGKK